jgi:hypothetical protein
MQQEVNQYKYVSIRAGFDQTEIKECSKRSTYMLLPFDPIVADTLEFIFRSTCTTRITDPFQQNLKCMGDILKNPLDQGKWIVDKNHFPRAFALKINLCRYTWKL